MLLDLQFKIKNNPNYIKYLREHSYWYKFLNRVPNSFKDFEEEVKTNYKLRPSDKISRTLDTFDMLGHILEALKK
ncbi:MAG: YlbE-like family protein [Bacilli bacterium]